MFCENGLLVLLGEAGSRLDWGRLWRTGGTEKACRLWTLAAKLLPVQRRKARAKLSRYLRTYRPERVPAIRLPATDDTQIAAALQAIRRAVGGHIESCLSKWHARVVVGRIRLRKIGPRGKNDLLLDH